MSSIPDQFFSSAEFDTNPNHSKLSGAPVPHVAAAAGTAAAMWCSEEEFTVPYFNSAGVDSFFSPPPPLPASEKLGFYDSVVPAFPAEYSNIDIVRNNNMMDHLHGIIPEGQGFGGLGFNNNIINVPHLDNGFDHQFGDEYCCSGSFSPEFKPVISVVAGGQNGTLGIQSNQIMNGIDQVSNMMKVGRYSEEERKERIVRYLKKRNQRNFNKTIKYACRKTLADRRVRVRGRFARNNELICDDQQLVGPKVNVVDHPNTKKDMRELCFDDALQIKYDDDDDWLENFALCCWVNGGSSN